METKPLDFLIATLCIGALLGLAWVSTWFLSISHPYHVVLDVVVFLLAYGLYTALLLAILRRLKPYPLGRHSMNSAEFTYWKLNAVLMDLATKAMRPFTTVFTEPLFYALFGASVGRQTAQAGIVRDLPLIRFGDYCTIGQNSVITAHAITHDEIILTPVEIGERAVVGVNCVVMPGVKLGKHAVLAAGAVATPNTVIPAYELWGGVPARKIKSLAIPPTSAV